MQITTPSWRSNLPCPCCGQGHPMLVACTRCGHIAAECEEVGTFFPNASNLEASRIVAVYCLRCLRPQVVCCRYIRADSVRRLRARAVPMRALRPNKRIKFARTARPTRRTDALLLAAYLRR